MDIRKQRRSVNFMDRGSPSPADAYARNGNALPHDDYLDDLIRNSTINMPVPYRSGYDLSLTDIHRLNEFDNERAWNAPFIEGQPLPDGFAPTPTNRRDSMRPTGIGVPAIPRPRNRRAILQALR